MTAANVTPLKKDKSVDNPVQRPAPSAERKSFEVIKSRYAPENAKDLLTDATQFIDSQNAPEWLQSLRHEALTQLQQRGLPTPRLERWKYTRMHGYEGLLSSAPMTPKRASFDAGDLPQSLAPLRVVFVDGHFNAELSVLPEGLKICGDIASYTDETLVQELWNNAPLERYNDQMQWALNSLYATSGMALEIPANMVMENPIEMLYVVTQPHRVMPRHVITIGNNAQAIVIERYVDMTQSEDGSAVNIAATITLGQNARLTHHKVQNWCKGDMVLGTLHVRQARDSHYEAYGISASREVMNRQQIWVQLQGENAETFLNGVQFSRAHQHMETVIHMDHEAPHCTSNQDYRHVAADDASCVFQGKVQVHQIAQKTEAYQMSRGIVLSPRAEVNTKPELEIYADDVKCSHGATTGQMDEQALFYMRSRGLSYAEARRMLLTSFAAEVFTDLDEEHALTKAHLDILGTWLQEVLA